MAVTHPPSGCAGSTPARRTRHGSFVYRYRTLAPQAGKAGSIPARAAEQHDQVVELADTRRSERRALEAWEFDSPLGHWHIAGAAGAQLAFIRPVRPVRYRGLQLRVGQCSAGPHKPGPPGATPGPATTGYANWHSGEVESLVPVGSSPTSVTGMIPWSSGNDAWADSREDDGSSPSGITRRSVGVSAAHLLGKEEDRVRLPDGPLVGWHVPWRRLIPARSVRWVRLPSGPLITRRARGPKGRHRPGVAEIRVRFPAGPLHYGR